jgi:hypothetical protein
VCSFIRATIAHGPPRESIWRQSELPHRSSAGSGDDRPNSGTQRGQVLP